MLIGVLVTSVVALGVAVVILATNSGEGNDRKDDDATQTTAAVVGPPCQLESMGGEVEIEMSSEAIGCAEARGIYSEFKELIRSGEATGIGEASDVSNWNCKEFPLAEYPLIVRCRQGQKSFAVIGLAPSAHEDQGPSPTHPRNSAEGFFFQTPSGNIGCAMQETSVRCDISKRDWSPPPEPEDCALDWGHAIELHRSGSTFLCAGDTVISRDHPVLPYGEGAAVGGFLCESQAQKLICVNARSEHGFWLSIQEVKLF